MKKSWKLNTSNMGKFAELQKIFAKHDMVLEATHVDLQEIDAEPIEVVAHKATQLGDNILVEDTSLEVEGEAVGVHVKWLLDHLPKYVGRKAEWTVLLAYRQGSQVYIYKGTIFGVIVEPRGDSGFGFDPIFVPNGFDKTLAEMKVEPFNARAKAVEALIKGDVWATHPAIEEWQGSWQKD